MKQQNKSTLTVLFLFLLATFVFTGCQKDSEIISSKSTDNTIRTSENINAARFANSVQPSMYNEVVDIEQDVWIPCANGGTGENVHFQGKLHIIFEFTFNGNTAHGKYFFQLQGLTGTGEITGDKYRATGVTQGENVNSSTSIRVVVFINNFNIIGPGPGNNLKGHETVHVTYNANGDMTVTLDKINVDCK